MKEDNTLLRYALPLVHAVRYDSESHELAKFLVRRCTNWTPGNLSVATPVPSNTDAAPRSPPPAAWSLCCAVYWCCGVESALDEEEKHREKSPEGGAAAPVLPLVFLRRALREGLTRHAPGFLVMLRQQEEVVHFLKRLSSRLAAHGGDRTSSIERGKRKLRNGEYGLRELFQPDEGAATPSVSITLPTHPEQPVAGVRANDFYIFKSAKKPFRLTFVRRADGLSVPPPPSASPRSSISVMFKAEDDIRQDALVLSLLTVMDHLLCQEGLDLHLTPYRVRPTSATDGLLEMVPNVVTFESVRRDVHGYWRRHQTTPARFDAAVQRYVKSLAGYCVATFILGVGDRHLENILMASDGRLLHIDFGYVFGHDPKPFSPPIRICKEMIAALGGPESSGFHHFKTYCCSAYNVLRQHAALLLYFLSAFTDAARMPQVTARVRSTGPGMEHGGELAAVESLVKMQEKLRLDLTNTQATQFMLNIIADSVGSLFADLWDAIHTAAQATRN